MPQTIREVMTKNPKTVSADSTATQAARIMRDSGIGVDEDNKTIWIGSWIRWIRWTSNRE